MPERTCARICRTGVSCQLNIRKSTSKSHLSDDVLDVWDEAWPDELDTDADVALDVGQDLSDILMNEVDAEGSKPDQQFDGRAAKNSIVAAEIEATELFKQFVMDQWSGNVKGMVAAFNLARSTDVKPM